MPVNPGDVLRVYTEAGPKQPRKYQPGGWRPQGGSVLQSKCRQHKMGRFFNRFSNCYMAGDDCFSE